MINYDPETQEWFIGNRYFDSAEDAEAYLESKKEWEGERKLMDLEWGEGPGYDF